MIFQYLTAPVWPNVPGGAARFFGEFPIAAKTITEATKDAQALKAAGRLEEALSAYQAIVAAYPTNAIARHNLATAYSDLGDRTSSEREIRKAMAMGLDAPESWLVLARCLLALGRLDESETAYSETLKRRPLYYDAQRELVQLRWMRGGDIGAAVGGLDAAIAAAPGERSLVMIKAQALTEAGDAAGALALLRAAAANDAGVLVMLAQAELAARDIGAARAAALRALALAPESAGAHAALIEALLAAGDVEASTAAGAFLAQAPLNQHAIALQATAWRLFGDARYGELYDYDAFVGVADIETPPGWDSLGAYLADLAAALNGAHHFRTHPFGQSIRHGSQVANVLQLGTPATDALRAALDAPIRARLAALGRGHDPLRARQRGWYAFQGMWSIRMRAGGRHINHVHPEGWISSACYVETPSAPGQEGWLKLGEPGVRTATPLAAEKFIEPKPGRLVLFPSYMWHGTVPFTGDGVRLTFAFDILPA